MAALGALGGQPAVGADPGLSPFDLHALRGLKEIMERPDVIDDALKEGKMMDDRFAAIARAFTLKY